jgi:subtilisin family serine protease
MKRFAPTAVILALVLPGAVQIAQARTPNDPYYGRQWYLDKVNAESAWDAETGSPDVIVAVIDTGVDIYHEDLKDNIWENPGEIAGNGRDDDGNGFTDDIYGWNFVRGSNDIRPFRAGSSEEAYVHGTSVSSIIAARGNNGAGIAGVAWGVRIMSIVGLDERGNGSTTDIANAVYYAVRNGADIINLSIEGPMRDEQLDEALAYARSKGVLTVTAAGNSDMYRGTDLDVSPVYPACASVDGIYGVIAVSGTGQSDLKAGYANYGSCVDVSAPSEDIFAAEPMGWSSAIPGDIPGYGGGYSGTSLAAPLVSGAAALLKSLHPSWGATELRDRIIQTAHPIDENNIPRYRGGLGTGRLDIGAALIGPASAATGGGVEIQATRTGVPTRVRIISDTDIIEVAPFDPDDTRGARVAVTDWNGDGAPEIGVVPATGSPAVFVLLGRDGQIRARMDLPGAFSDGALVAGTDDGFVVADERGGTAWGIASDMTARMFFPYEQGYAGGLDLLAAGGEAAFAPRNGGGRLVISNAYGKQLVSAFPFGFELSGRWSLARAGIGDAIRLVFSGPGGTKWISMDELGQTGWTDVLFADLERTTLVDSGGGRTEELSWHVYDAWPQ